jgi:hypothetical protein
MTNRIPDSRAAFSNSSNSNFCGGAMPPIARFSAVFIVATVAVQTTVLAQGLEVRRHNPSEWTKGRFSEVVTVNGPGKTIYLAGIGAEDGNGPAGAFESWKGFPSGSLHASLAHANRNFHYSRAC